VVAKERETRTSRAVRVRVIIRAISVAILKSEMDSICEYWGEDIPVVITVFVTCRRAVITRAEVIALGYGQDIRGNT
jgi:hypothetical protein